MTFEEYLATVSPVRGAPSATETEEHAEIRAAVEEISKLHRVTATSLGRLVSTNPHVVPALGLAVGLSREALRNHLKHRFDTSGWISLARQRPEALISMLDKDFGLIETVRSDRRRSFEYADVLIARSGGRQTAGRAIAGGRFVEDAIEGIARSLGLPHELRTRFVGRGGNSAPCDLAFPRGGAEAKIVCAAKGFDSTGSKLTDAVREIEQMAEVRLPTQFVYAVVDGIGWKSRKADLRRIFELREAGQIDGLYTVATLDNFARDLRDAARRLGLL